MSYITAKNREAGWPLDREEPRNFLFLCSYVLMSYKLRMFFCLDFCGLEISDIDLEISDKMRVFQADGQKCQAF